MAEGGISEFSPDSPSNQASRDIFGLESLEHYLGEFIQSNRKEMTVLLGGKTGVGKSHLTNALIGQELAEEGEDLDPLTMEVEPHTIHRNNVKITIFDTPGLADGTGNENEYLRKTVEQVRSVDLFLYCAQMIDTKIRPDDIQTINTLTKTFGEQVWEHALIVLTFANRVHPPRRNRTEGLVDYFNKRLRLFKKKYQEVLHLKANVPSEIALTVPVVPAGELFEPKLPDRENWMTAFWVSAFKRVNRNAKSAFLLASIDRLKGSLAKPSKQGESSGSTQLRPRRSLNLLSPQDKERFPKKLSRRSFHGFEIEDRDEGEAHGNGDDDCFYEDPDDLSSPFCQLSPEERKSIKSSRRNLKQCGFEDNLKACLEAPPPYKRIPGGAVPIVMDESDRKEFVGEILGRLKLGSARQILGSLIQPDLGGIYERILTWIMESVKKLPQKFVGENRERKEPLEHDERLGEENNGVQEVAEE